MVERNVDIFSYLACDGLTQAEISLTILNTLLARKLELRSSSPYRRLVKIERLSKTVIPVNIIASPRIPRLTDHEIQGILETGKDAGAKSAICLNLSLPRKVSGLFKD